MNKNKPRVFIIGPAGSGKTTACTIIQTWFSESGRNIPKLGIDEAHRKLLVPGSEDGTYRYEQEGSLILLDREAQDKRALALLIQECRRAADTTGFIAEITLQPFGIVLSEFDSFLLAGALLLHIYAPIQTRLVRNATRGPAFVPESVIHKSNEQLMPDVYEIASNMAMNLQVIDSSSSIELFENKIRSILDELSL